MNYRHISAILLMGFASGLPIGLITSTLQAWYTVSGASLLAIGWLTVIGQPYAYKFLWAPLLDRWSPLKIGRRRSWILVMQALLVCVLMMMAFLHPAKNPLFLAFIALMVAIFSATQDTAIDAYRTELLSEEERGLGASVTTIGYRLAMMVSGALALIIAAKLGWREMYLLMAICVAVLMLGTLSIDNPAETEKSPSTLREAMVAPLKSFFARENAWIILAIIVMYKLPDAMAISLNTTFLIRAMHFSLVEIGVISKSVGLSAMIVGSVIGGLLLPRFGMYRSLWIFGILQTLSIVLSAWLALVGKNMVVMSIAIFGENFCSGLSTVAFIVFLMSLCDKRYTATQYALFSAIASLGRIFIGPVSAVMVDNMGWVNFYFFTALIGLPALLLLGGVRSSTERETLIPN